MTTKLTYIQIPGHGYLRVPLGEIDKLGISHLISGFSYKDSEFAYLECVEDMATYLEAIKKGFDELAVTIEKLADFPDKLLDSFNPADPWLRVNDTPEGKQLGRELLYTELNGKRPVETKKGREALQLMHSLLANSYTNG